jgi:hypothetical protein
MAEKAAPLEVKPLKTPSGVCDGGDLPLKVRGADSTGQLSWVSASTLLKQDATVHS